MSGKLSSDSRMPSPTSLLKKASTVGKATARLFTLFGQKKPGAMLRAATAGLKCITTELTLRQASRPWYYRIYDTEKHKVNLQNILKLVSSTLKCSAMFTPGPGLCDIALLCLTKATTACDIIEAWRDFKKLITERKFIDIFKTATFEVLNVSASLGIEMMCGAGTLLEIITMSLITSTVMQCEKHLNECGAKSLSNLIINTSSKLGLSKTQSQEKNLLLQYLKVGKASASVIEAWESLFGQKP